jgi:hypothetical protein
MNELIHDGTPVTGNAGQCASIRSQHFAGAMLPFWDTRNRPLLEAKNEVLCGRHVPARLGHNRFRAASRVRCDLDPYSTIPAFTATARRAASVGDHEIRSSKWNSSHDCRTLAPRKIFGMGEVSWDRRLDSAGRLGQDIADGCCSSGFRVSNLTSPWASASW